ncbi:MAG: hydroxymethylbilane synthase [Methanobacteriaceae archaeon]
MIVGTRGSKLALTQTNQVAKDLSNVTGTKIEKKIIKTKGDKITTSQLYNMDSKGLFTKELDNAVLDEEVDFAVHSLKDVPTDLDEDLEIVAVPIRQSPLDVLVSNRNWDELGEGSTLGSSSLRREAFCNYHKKGFKLQALRGNIDTRINKVLEGEVDATIMAEAGLNRLGLSKFIKHKFTADYIMPPAGQGALAIITRCDSCEKDKIVKLNDYNSQQEVLAEKTVLEELGIGCQWPLGVLARTSTSKPGAMELSSVLLTKEGEMLSKVELEGSIKEAYALGKKASSYAKEYI